jgi:hypothetical protein
MQKPVRQIRKRGMYYWTRSKINRMWGALKPFAGHLETAAARGYD